MGRGVIYSMSDVYKLSTGCVIVGNVLKNWKYIAVIVMMACTGSSAPLKDEKAGFFLAGVVDTKSIAGSQEREKQLISMLDALSSASSELAGAPRPVSKHSPSFRAAAACPCRAARSRQLQPPEGSRGQPRPFK